MADSRASILKQIPERVRFLALILLAMEAILGGLAWRMPDPYKPWLLGAIVLFLLIFVVIATYIEIRILNSGTWLLPYAALFAQDLIDVLDGYLANLPPAEQTEAWTSLRDVLVEVDDPQAPRTYQKFRGDVADFIAKKRIVGRAKRKTQGPIPSG